MSANEIQIRIDIDLRNIFYEPVIVRTIDQRLVGIATCKICESLVLIDPSMLSRGIEHANWHKANGDIP